MSEYSQMFYFLFTDVNFVKSFDIGHYVYFFFRERSLECASCGKLKISRVARICKVKACVGMVNI